jgi:hypothetical protein
MTRHGGCHFTPDQAWQLVALRRDSICGSSGAICVSTMALVVSGGRRWLPGSMPRAGQRCLWMEQLASGAVVIQRGVRRLDDVQEQHARAQRRREVPLRAQRLKRRVGTIQRDEHATRSLGRPGRFTGCAGCGYACGHTGGDEEPRH